MEKAHYNKFTLNKEKNIINDYSKSSMVLWYKMRKWEYFFKDKKKEREKIEKHQKKRKSREQKRGRENKRKKEKN